MGEPEKRDDIDEQFDYGLACGLCNGEGFIVVCMDDICRDHRGYCIHGDGEITCMECQGNG